MYQSDKGPGLLDAALTQAKRRALRWLIGTGIPAFLAGGGWVVIVIVIVAVFVAGIGYWVAGFLTGAPPPMGTVTARTLEWLPAVDQYGPGLPNALSLAVIARTSGGEVYGDRYYCVDGSAEQSSGIRCTSAYGKAWHNLGTGYGLTGVNGKDVTLPSSTSGNSPHTVAWNLTTGLTALAHTLQTTPALQTALPTFHKTTQAPPGWVFSGYANTIRTDLQTYGGPQMAVWAIAPWNQVTGAYEDSSGTKDWILVAAGAPTGAPWTLEWRAPTVKYVQKTQTEQVPVTVTKKLKVLIPHTKPKRYRTVTKKTTKIVTKTVTHTVREVIDHNLTGRQLEEPVSVYATLTDGKTHPLTFSGSNSNVPVWPGATLWGGQFNLHQIRSITAVWPGVPPTTETLPWPPVSGQAVGTVATIPITNAVRHWWTAIQAASTQTGVPAGIIAAILLHESGGQPTAYNPAGPAYGLMQILNTTAPGLPGYAPGWQTNGPLNLLMGAQALQEDYRAAGSASWRAAIAAYYGGLGTMERLGYRPGMSWTQAAPLLTVVPGASSGNTVTMTTYADQMQATAQQITASHP